MENVANVSSNLKLREEFVQDLNGTTTTEVMLFLSQVPLYVFVPLFIELCILNKFNINVYKTNQTSIYSSIIVFMVETMTIVFPLVFMFTVLSNVVYHIFLLVAIVTFAIIMYSASSPDDCVHYWKLPSFKSRPILHSEYIISGKQPFITYFRSFVLLITSISILAVDFHVFPRRFAKTETYGVSIMDLGVGLFVMSNALVCKKHTILTKKFNNILLESMVLLMLGVVRYVLIQRLDYQKHVSEYGLHWNFFITLALVKVLSFLLLKLSRGHSFICGLFSMLLHQYLLMFYLEPYVLSNVERDNWFNANREGIVSLGGYLSLYLLGVAISSIVNLRDAQFTLWNKLRTLVLLLTLSSFLFIIYSYFSSLNFKVSRRLANLPFTIWVIAISLALLAFTLIVELLSTCFLPIQPRFKNKIYYLLTPALLESINYNGLLFFLISNLLTGVVNMYFDVLNLETLGSLFILLTYMFINSIVVFILYMLNIQVKLW